ncbi:MAG: hypothetical protein PF436_06415 [Prolixibacteraceae bacterium]|nr:hypothetical protein [Prolixibacteraceae bacterium]
MKSKIILIVLATAILGLWSCQDSIESTPGVNNDEALLKSAEIAENDLLTESILDEANFEVGIFAEYEKMLRKLTNYKGSKNLKPGNMGNRYKNDSSISVSIDTSETGYPIVITIDYGDETVLNNGRVLGGEVTIEVSAPRGTDGANRITSYNQCVFDSVLIDGQYAEIFTIDNDSLCVVSATSDVTFTLPDSTVLTRTGEYTRSWTPTNDSLGYGYDRVTTITGQTSIESSNGNVWQSSIVEPIIRIADCRYPVQGIVQITQNGTLVAEIDFGTGECDNVATLTANGETVDIELQGQKPEAKVDKNRGEDKQNKQKGQSKDKGNSDNRGGKR